MKEPAMATVSADRPKKGPKVLEEVRIKRSMDGGHVITHHYEGYQHEPRPYEFGKDEGARAAAHVQRHTGIPMSEAADDGAGEAEEEA
jgi:hypothetical protein